MLNVQLFNITKVPKKHCNHWIVINLSSIPFGRLKQHTTTTKSSTNHKPHPRYLQVDFIHVGAFDTNVTVKRCKCTSEFM